MHSRPSAIVYLINTIHTQMDTTFPVEAFQSLHTPFYYYDTGLLQKTLETVNRHLRRHPSWHMHYAVKANANPVLLKQISMVGFGADCVSGGEVIRAIENGFAPESVVFAGVGKSDWEIDTALERGIGCFNVESESELCVIEERAAAKDTIAPVALRVNPDIGAHTHANITTGLAENKFGINLEQLFDVIDHALSLPHITFQGLHFHIGSQITDVGDFVALCNRINTLTAECNRRGITIHSINVGGGLGVDYQHPDKCPMADFDAYFEVFERHLDLLPSQELHFELGRAIVAPCGSLICRVLYIKEGTTKRFVIVDGSMTELIRPALYHALHLPQNITPGSAERPLLTCDLVGPVCESSDVFAKAFDLPACQRGDLIALRTAGAYGETMASCYNCHPLPATYFSHDFSE